MIGIKEVIFDEKDKNRGIVVLSNDHKMDIEDVIDYIQYKLGIVVEQIKKHYETYIEIFPERKSELEDERDNLLKNSCLGKKFVGTFQELINALTMILVLHGQYELINKLHTRNKEREQIKKV